MSDLQRLGGSIDLNLHIHSVVLDGAYAGPEDTGAPTFYALPVLDDQEIARGTAAVAKRVGRLLTRRGPLPEERRRHGIRSCATLPAATW